MTKNEEKLIAAIKDAINCVQWCRRKHREDDGEQGIPSEVKVLAAHLREDAEVDRADIAAAETALSEPGERISLDTLKTNLQH